MGIPVVIAENGQGFPVRPVEDNAPVMTVAENGLGAPVVISELGAPFVVEGIAPPIDWNWQTFSMTNGGDGVQWVGYSVGGATLPNPAFGSISNEPTDKATLLAFYQDTASGVVLAVFSGEWETELAGLEVSLGGLVLYPFEIEVISGNTWLRYDGMPGLWTEGVVYEVLFGWGLEPVFDPSSEALFARFTTPPTDGRKWLINNLIVSLKDADVWSKLDALYLMAAADNQAARRNWIVDQYNLTAVASPDFTADRGYTGDGLASYLDTGFNPATAVGAKFKQNDASMWLWSRTDLRNQGGTSFDFGAATDNRIGRSNTATPGLALGRPLSGVTITSFIVDAYPGFMGWSRSSASAWVGYAKAVAVTSGSEAGVAPSNASMGILGPTNRGVNQIAFAAIGSNISPAEEAAFYNSINTYLQAVGAA